MTSLDRERPFDPLRTRNALSSIIVVDDDPAVRNSLKFSLEVEGFAVRAYASATDLLSSPDSRGSACYVIDQNMPGMAGLELIARLRELNASAPAIIITTHPNAALTDRAARAGIPIVEKPLLCNTLVDVIRGVFA